MAGCLHWLSDGSSSWRYEAGTGELEEKRRDKVIGSSLEAMMCTLTSESRTQYEFLKPYEDDLPALFIVSQVELREVVKYRLMPL